MNRFLKGAVLGMAMWGLSLPTFASIENECSGNNQHAVEVCPYIYQMRAELAEIGSPPQPFVEKQLTQMEGPNVDFDAPEGSSSNDGNPCAGLIGYAYVTCLQQQ